MRIALLQKKLLISATLIVFGYQFTLPDTSAQQEKKHVPSSNKPASDQPENLVKKEIRSRDELLAFHKKTQALVRVVDEQTGLLHYLVETLTTYQERYGDDKKIEKLVKTRMDEFRNQIKRDFSLSEETKKELIANEEKKSREGAQLSAKHLRETIEGIRHELLALRIRKTILLLPQKAEGQGQTKWMELIDAQQQNEKYKSKKRLTTAQRQLLYLQLAYIEFLKFKQDNHDLNSKKIDVIFRKFHQQLDAAFAKKAQPDTATMTSKLIESELKEIESLSLRIQADQAGVEFLETLIVHQLRNHEELVRVKGKAALQHSNSNELKIQIQSLKNELREVDRKEEVDHIQQAIRDRNSKLHDIQSQSESLRFRLNERMQEVEENEKQINKIWNSINIFPADFYSFWIGSEVKTQKNVIHKLLNSTASTELAKEFSKLEAAK